MRKGTPGPENATERARELVGELLLCGAEESAPPPATAAAAGAEVVLDVAMDGWRYQLLRTIPHEDTVSLSSRELEIARMIAGGHTNRTVAVILEISPWTVSTHLRRVFAKLGVGSRAAMAARLVAEGLISPPNGSTSARPPEYSEPNTARATRERPGAVEGKRSIVARSY
jgi:DNA-binding CsgD family transcriptional regulator